ncbi:MAG: ELM1/GtrOC1 family putative glycosyltransferase [Pseudomonadales bacterium]
MAADADKVVWLITGRKAGDNSQLHALGRQLALLSGVRVEEKPIVPVGWELLLHVTDRPTLSGIRPAGRGQFAEPWPALVLSAGRRNELVARWVRRASGGTSQLVHLGRPWSALAEFSLVITTPQYSIGGGTNVLELGLPVTPAIDADNVTMSVPRDDGDLLAVMVGGHSGSVIYNRGTMRRLMAEVATLHGETGGRLRVCTSPRTPDAAVDVLRELVPEETLWVWRAGATDNPYQTLLRTATRFVVTSDSMSMLAEATATGRPVYVFDARDSATVWWRQRSAWRWRALSHRLVNRFAPRRFHRNVHALIERLVTDGRVTWLRTGSAGFAPRVDADTDTRLAVEALARMLGVTSVQPTAAPKR